MIEALAGWMAHPGSAFLVLTGLGFSYYLVLAVASYLVFFVWWRDKYNPGFVPDWRDQGSAIGWGLVSIAGNAALMLPLHMLALSGWSRTYWDVADYGWGWLVVSFGLLMVISETAVYWVHRWLHTRGAFKHIHLFHHKWREPTPFVGVAFHPVDSFAQALPHHLCAFLFPMHGVLYLACVGFLTMWAVAIHDRVSLVRWGWLNYTGHHTIHHFYNNYNFGQYTTLWDRWMGTYREPQGPRFLRP
jgi:lathosterol oxidase